MKRIVAAVVMLAAAGAMAQAKAPQKKTKPVQTVDFNGTVLQGDVIGPAIDDVITPPPFTFRNMIKIRADFSPELAKSVESL